jgi:hypothetical protein
MSVSDDDIAELRRRFRDGDIGADELIAALQELDQDTDRDELWARWASQGLFDEAIEQEGYTSLRGGIPEQVDGDG